MAKVSLRAYNQEIEAMIDRGHLDEAIAHCRHILKTFPKHLETYRLLGKAYLEYKRYPEAVDIFSRVLATVPSDFIANVGMSIIRDEENQLDNAIWHMERAFETQPSNAAIQSELQRLYGRREGVQPPRIRMTRGALAHMYVQGELYPQAISEIKSVLKEDPGRSDMQVLLARAYYRSGLKNDAADVASAVLRSNPHNLDANRVMVEILGADRPESVQVYRQRVIELDPYAAQVTSSIFLSNEVPDAAVNLEHLDWNGQPVGLRPDWQTAQGISLESGPKQDEQPDWLKGALGEAPPRSSQPASVSPFDAAMPSANLAEPSDEIPDFLREAGWGKSTGAFDESKSAFAESEPVAGEAPIEQGDLPDWVKAMAPQQPAETSAEEDELPDWINKIGTSALPVSSEATDQPDWMKGFEPSAPPPAEEQPDWLKQPGATQPAATSSSEEEPDWLKGFGSQTEATPPSTAAGDLDWLDQLTQAGGSEAKSIEASSDALDFITKPSEPFDAAPSTPAADAWELPGEPGVQPETASVTPSADEFDFLDPLRSQLKGPASAGEPEEFDFLNELKDETEQLAPSAAPEASKAEPLGMSEEEQDDSFAWLESLAAKQGATEGLLTKPEERLEEEPDWIKQLKDTGAQTIQPPVEEPPVTQPAGGLEEPGKSEQEQDAFAWLESLAAKQGATEGLLTKPEERLEEAPDWVQQAGALGEQTYEAPPVETPPAEEPSLVQPSSTPEALGTTEQEREDSFAWLEALAAKQGASEGLLTKPEERSEEEPDWIKQAKDLDEHAALTPMTQPPASRDDTGIWLRSLDEETSQPPAGTEEMEQPDWMKQEEAPAEEPSLASPAPEQPVAQEDAEQPAWLKGLDEEEPAPLQPQAGLEAAQGPGWLQPEEVGAEEPAPTAPMDEIEVWLRSLDAETTVTPEAPQAMEEQASAMKQEEAPSIPEISSADDTAIWLKSLDEPKEVAPEAAPAMPAMQPEELPAWMENIEEEKQAEEPALAAPEVSEETAEVSAWIGSIEEPEPAAPEAPKVDTGGLPSWLRGLEKEETEPVRFGAQEDLPAWLRDASGESITEPTEIEPTRSTDWQPVEMEARQSEPEPVPQEPVAQEPEPEVLDVVSIIEEKIAVAESEPEKPVPPAKPSKEPLPRKVTGSLTDPVLGQARGELSRSNISGALENYSRLIKKGRLLEDIIFDLREALYRYPVDVDIWQSLGDAYMRSNRLQDALDAYTKAEELLR